MSLAKRVLIEQHGMRSLPDLTFAIVITALLVILHLLLPNHFLVLKVNIEQDLSLILFQQICVRTSRFKDLKRRTIKLILE